MIKKLKIRNLQVWYNHSFYTKESQETLIGQISDMTETKLWTRSSLYVLLECLAKPIDYSYLTEFNTSAANKSNIGIYG